MWAWSLRGLPLRNSRRRLVKVNSGLTSTTTALGAFTERLEAVEPPEEVTDWHNAVLVYQRALKMELDDGPGEGESEEEYIFSTVLTLVIEHQ